MRKNLIARLMLVGVISLSVVMPGLASSIDGGCGNHIVAPHSKKIFQVTFRGDQTASVAVRGDGSSDLDLYVYDENGRQVAKDDGNTDNCLVTWRPLSTGAFTIVVVNRGSNYNQYAICTN